MAEALRLQILKALTAVIETVHPTDSESPYTFDLRAAVFRGRIYYGDDDPLPMASLIEPPKELDQLEPPPDTGSGTGDWDLFVQGFVKDDPDNPCDPAYQMLAEVRMALLKARAEPEARRKLGEQNYPLLGIINSKGKPGVTKLSVGFGVVRPPDQDADVAFFFLPLRIQLVEDGSQGLL
jgi:hypothetical protein